MTDGHVKNYEEGLGFCHSAGGTLIIPRNKEQNQALSKLLDVVKAEYVFLGLNDRKTESSFVDTEGKTLHFFKWNNGEPDNQGEEEDCVVMATGGSWNDVPCEQQYLIVCELA